MLKKKKKSSFYEHILILVLNSYSFFQPEISYISSLGKAFRVAVISPGSVHGLQEVHESVKLGGKKTKQNVSQCDVFWQESSQGSPEAPK